MSIDLETRLPGEYHWLIELVGEQVYAKRSGWDVEPDDDHDLAWKDEGISEEVRGELDILIVAKEDIPFIPLVGTIPVDPDTIERLRS
jgi:hypothetical protein